MLLLLIAGISPIKPERVAYTHACTNQTHTSDNSNRTKCAVVRMVYIIYIYIYIYIPGMTRCSFTADKIIIIRLAIQQYAAMSFNIHLSKHIYPWKTNSPDIKETYAQGLYIVLRIVVVVFVLIWAFWLACFILVGGQTEEIRHTYPSRMSPGSVPPGGTQLTSNISRGVVRVLAWGATSSKKQQKLGAYYPGLFTSQVKPHGSGRVG